MRHECAIGPVMTWGIVVARKAVARSEALAEKVKKLEAQLEARERAQATESCPRADRPLNLYLVLHESLKYIFYAESCPQANRPWYVYLVLFPFLFELL